ATAGVLLVALLEGLRGKEQVVVRGRTIPQRRVLDAMILALAVGMLFAAGAMILSLMNGLPILIAGFEVASALGTVGLSMGATTELNLASSFLIILFMYLGRVGILTFSVAFLTRGSDRKLSYPTVDIMIG
ncbi:MAG: potassium transporter TrkG, partial [Lawsonibacter sp.]|nr:potassium transporter TrkG [Lawsonibacter sp.]